MATSARASALECSFELGSVLWLAKALLFPASELRPREGMPYLPKLARIRYWESTPPPGPPVVVGISHDAPRGTPHLIKFALEELRELRSGAQEVKLRMAELLFVDVMRRYLAAIASA